MISIPSGKAVQAEGGELVTPGVVELVGEEYRGGRIADPIGVISIPVEGKPGASIEVFLGTVPGHRSCTTPKSWELPEVILIDFVNPHSAGAIEMPDGSHSRAFADPPSVVFKYRGQPWPRYKPEDYEEDVEQPMGE